MEEQLRNTLPKKERLCGKTAISKLLAGKKGSVPGMRFIYIKDNGADTNRIVVSVSKKFFKRAVKRNLLKRRIRESYRMQKHALEVKGVDILFIYFTKEILSYEEIYKAVGQIIDKINQSAAPKPGKDETVAE